MKLNLLFIVMDLLTLLAYPILYIHSKIRQILRSIVIHKQQHSRLLTAAKG